MGSGSSSNIKTIHIDQEDELSKDLKKKTSNPLPGKGISQSEENSGGNGRNEDKAADIETLTKQLCESESQRLDLEDHVETLMKELDYLNSENVQREGDQRPCEETVHAKDQYIDKLEKEKKELETEVNKMKQKQRRKQKQFNTQMAEYKQEVNFQQMELKEEISKLKTENKSLKEGKGEKGTDSSKKLPTENDAPKLPGGEKMALILELSEQVAEQQDKISKLEHKLNEKDQIVNDLRTKLKNNAQYLSVLNKTKDGNNINETSSVVNVDSNNRNKNRSSNNGGNSNARKNLVPKNDKAKTNNNYMFDVDGLFTVDEESSENEEDSLLKLSSNLSGVRSYSKIRMSPDMPEESKNNVSRNVNMPEPFEDLDGNNGRDSGLGSAGKRDDNGDQITESGNSVRTVTGWKEMGHSFESGSGLSDSDFEQYGPGQSKVSSAPPKLQNSGSVRLKKKSNSLRRHASRKEDRPPRPGMAFVNSTGTLQKDDHIVNKLAPIISPVEVS